MSADNDLFGNVKASMRKHLGVFADVYMQNKIAILRKLSNQIAATNTTQELYELNKALNNVLLSKEDIDVLGSKLDSLMTMIETHYSRLDALKKIRNF